MKINGEQRQAMRYSLELPVEVAGTSGRTRDFSASGVFFVSWGGARRLRGPYVTYDPTRCS